LIQLRTTTDEFQVSYSPLQGGKQSGAVENCATLRSSGVDHEVSVMRRIDTLKPYTAANRQKLVTAGEGDSPARQHF
jgi:hypothetical protein